MSIKNNLFHLFGLFLFGLIFSCAGQVNQNQTLSTVDELKAALKTAQPGDTLLMANGEWKNAELKLEANGEKDAPIVVMAETPGQVKLTGNSNLKIGGEYLVVSGLLFTDGYTLTSEVISFKINKERLANNCRVTQTVVCNYSKPERHESDYWVGMYGKNNRFDHNALVGKGNKGVTMAVRLNSENSQENNHLIDYNYFGPRENLGANGGETLRIGTSHYSLTNSNTQVLNNYFDRCDGEHEIISNKSGGNLFKGNVFYECVGTLTFRHGNNNVAESNAFYGNKKWHTGGIRVINAGQKVVNNYMEGLTGHRFRGALVIMNGVPNSPINRYHQVKDALMDHNTLIDCDFVQLCAGSDAERSAIPMNSAFTNNLIWNDGKSDIFTVYDDISGISFDGNVLSQNVENIIGNGFDTIASREAAGGAGVAEDFEVVSREDAGPSWYQKPADSGSEFGAGNTISVKPGEDLYEIIKSSGAGDIVRLEAGEYLLEKAVDIKHPLTVEGTEGSVVKFERPNLFRIENGGKLSLKGLTINGEEAPDYAGNAVITTSKYSMNRNYKLFIEDCVFEDLDVNHSFNLLRAYKNTFADSIFIKNTIIRDLTGNVLDLTAETDDIGIYNAEFVILENNQFENIGQQVVALHRGGGDESTFGPLLFMTDCSIKNAGFDKRNKSGNAITLHGVQRTVISQCEIEKARTVNLFHTVGEPITKLSNITFKYSNGLKTNDDAYESKNVVTKK